MNIYNEKKILYGLIGVAALFAVIVAGRIGGEGASAPSVSTGAEAIAVPERAMNPFARVELAARSAYVWDVKNKETLFFLNGDTQLPLASLTKVMTAVVAAEAGVTGPVVITRDSLIPEGDQGFRPGEEWLLSSILDVTLLASSNDGARAIATALGASASSGEGEGDPFVRAMNQKARALGLTQTYFLNESGLDVNQGVSGAYGSARDVARLFAYAVTRHPSLVEATTRATLEAASLSGKPHTLKNTNKLVEKIPGLMASKTGFTDLAGGNLAVAFDAGIAHPVVVVVMGSTEDERFTDVEKLVFASLEHLKNEQHDRE